MVGHLFLKSLGKTRLRPGGKVASDWLISKLQIDDNLILLEVACHSGNMLIELANKYDYQFTGIDIDEQALKEAKDKTLNFNNIEVMYGNATKLPFADNSFDVIINEAMLTMLSYENKKKALMEYERVLKPGGILLTHDIEIIDDQLNSELQKGANVPANALTANNWFELYNNSNLKIKDYKNGPMSLMNPVGLVRDEGLFTTLKIIKNGLKRKNRKQFIQMFKYFKKNKKNLNYIAIYSYKENNE